MDQDVHGTLKLKSRFESSGRKVSSQKARYFISFIEMGSTKIVRLWKEKAKLCVLKRPNLLSLYCDVSYLSIVSSRRITDELFSPLSLFGL